MLETSNLVFIVLGNHLTMCGNIVFIVLENYLTVCGIVVFVHSGRKPPYRVVVLKNHLTVRSNIVCSVRKPNHLTVCDNMVLLSENHLMCGVMVHITLGRNMPAEHGETS